MRYFRLSLLIVAACLLFAAPLALTGCGGGLSQEQRDSYLQMAKDYEDEAALHQKWAQGYRNDAVAVAIGPSAYDGKRRSYEVLAQQCDDVAKDYRQLALKYTELATK